MGAALTPRQLEVFALVSHYYGALLEPAPAAYVSRKLGLSEQRVRAIFQALHDLGWLAGRGSPAVPLRPLPRCGERN